ncbi:MAG: hypothetical protein IPH30_07280 [Betaproteobacteria bacterium]|nr:hypothetical protein [Betaproteobacteria bacterium]
MLQHADRAHGAGTADREVVDDHKDHVRVTPDNPFVPDPPRLAHERRRETGYYYVANEGLWPLCHIAHTRPVFRASRLRCHRAVNQRFADTVVESRTKNPIVLVRGLPPACCPG